MAEGINSWLGRAGLDVFRASTRIGVYAALWSAFFLSGKLHRVTLAWPRIGSIAAASLLMVFMVWEQTPSLSDRSARDRNGARIHAYNIVAETLERGLPPHAAVFQLPAVPYSEAGRTVNLPDYEHLQPFLASQTLRFSYGHLRTSSGHRWGKYVASLPVPEMIPALEEAGFSALWIDRRGFGDEAAGLVAQIRAQGRSEIAVPPGLPITLFRLKAPPATRLPDLSDPRLHEPWGPPEASARWLAVSGWYGLELAPGRSWRWASHEAVLGYWHEGPAEKKRLVFGAGGRTKTGLSMQLNGLPLWQGDLADGPAGINSVEIELQPGLNTFTWRLAGKTFRPGKGDPRELGFMIENPVLSAP
jgi:phosphoglycerol transferase